MTRIFAALAIVVASASHGWAAAPVTLSTLRAFYALSNTEASQSVPVAFEATVTYYRAAESTMFVQDGDLAVYVIPTATQRLVPGDRVFIKGISKSSFRPIVVADSISFLRKTALPKPLPVGFRKLVSPEANCRFVSVRGVVRSADLVYRTDAMTTFLELLVDGGIVDVILDSSDPRPLRELLNAEVEFTGTEAGVFDGKMQQTGVEIRVQSAAGLKILKRGSDPWTLPVTPMDQVFRAFGNQGSPERIRVHGILTYFQPGAAAVLQTGAKSIWIGTGSAGPMRVGDEADATGFPEVHDGFLTIAGGEFHLTHASHPITPQPVTPQQLVTSKHAFDLVSIEGQVVTAVREAAQDEYVIVSDGYLFSAIYRHSGSIDPGSFEPPSVGSGKTFPIGSKVRITGICILDSPNPSGHDVPFNILIRTYDDIAVVASPSFLTVRHLVAVVGLLLFAVLAASARGWMLERRLRQKTAMLASQIKAQAALERRRSLILEDISGARPLDEIIVQITELVSETLGGPPCWWQSAEGRIVGRCPFPSEAARIVREEIPAHAAAGHAAFFVAFPFDSKAVPSEIEAIAMGTRLVTLAIETRRLYSDLVHRSQYDLLTEIHNRFSLDKCLDSLIRDARVKGDSFGLIYIDLDEFKQVNDECGHQVGDLYLQEVAARMQRQVRSIDMLARIGGDEFAVLVPHVRGHSDLEEVALRIERCFDEPIAAGEYLLHASASVGLAVYPQDALTKDGLLNAADSAMYMTKNARKEIAQMIGKSRTPDSAFDQHN